MPALLEALGRAGAEGYFTTQLEIVSLYAKVRHRQMQPGEGTR